jgi:glycosyltransferase involved in cell wall biosynthesis
VIQPLSDVLFKGRTPHVVAIVPSYIASCQINVIKPLASLARAGHIKFKHMLEQTAGPSTIAWADVVVFCRNTEPGYRHLLNEALGRGRPVIYDIDDSFWDIPKSTDPDLARYHLQPSRLRQLEVYIQYASLVRVYSPLLKAKVSRFNQSARIYRSSFDFAQVPELKPIPSGKKKIGIVYATSRTVDDQYRVFLPALEDFLNRHHAGVEMTVWGCNPSELLTLPGVTAKRLVSKYDDFLREFSRSGFQIGLAPLQDNEFNRSKNNTKFRDYGACGIAGIYSNVDAYSSSIVDGEEGLLVRNTKEAWRDALERLVFDSALQEKIRLNARKKVFNDYRQELIESQWLEDIHRLVADVPSFWLANAKHADTVELDVTADYDGFCGIEVQEVELRQCDDSSNKIYLEVQSPTGKTLRGIASSIINYDSGGAITFNFDKIRNSQARAFKLRITGVSGPDRSRVHKDVKLLYAVESFA